MFEKNDTRIWLLSSSQVQPRSVFLPFNTASIQYPVMLVLRRFIRKVIPLYPFCSLFWKPHDLGGKFPICVIIQILVAVSIYLESDPRSELGVS